MGILQTWPGNNYVYQPTVMDPNDYYHSLPKVELHRHLEGSVRLETLLEVGRAHGMPMPGTSQLRELVQIGNEDKLTFGNFLSKFQTLRLFYRSPDVIERITQETIADAAEDNVRYLELRFTPVALSRAESFPLADVIDWVIDASQAASQEYGIKTRLIASVNRQEGTEIAEEVLDLVIPRMERGIVGIDLAGNEAEYSGMAFLGVFKKARQAGLKITIHAGEWGGAENIMNAILYLGAERIGHGVRILEDPEVVELAHQLGTPLEVCVTSNYQSGVTPSLEVHPLPRMLNLGLNATINTDDPSISRITLTNEYRQACEDLRLSRQALQGCILAAAQAAFLPDDEKAQLTESLKKELNPA